MKACAVILGAAAVFSGAGALKVQFDHSPQARAALHLNSVKHYETTGRAKDRNKYTYAQEYNSYNDGTCYDNVTMVKLQLAIDGTDGGEQRVADLMKGKYKNLTRCWNPVLLNDDVPEQQNSAIFVHDTEKKCALSWSGIIGGKHADSVKSSVLNNIRLNTRKFCGYEMFSAFVDHITAHTNTTTFRKMMAYAASPACSGGVKLTGVSRGAIYASMLTACAMEGKLKELGDGMPDSFPVDSLWGYGNTGITELVPVTNKSHPDGCINGQRIVMGDQDVNRFQGEVDFLPPAGNLAKLSPLMHNHALYFAKTALMEIVDSKTGLETIVYPCTTDDAVSRPYDTPLLTNLVVQLAVRAATHQPPLQHECRHYIDQLEEMNGVMQHRCPGPWAKCNGTIPAGADVK